MCPEERISRRKDGPIRRRPPISKLERASSGERVHAILPAFERGNRVRLGGLTHERTRNALSNDGSYERENFNGATVDRA